MLDYQWGNPSTIILSGEETHQESEPNRPVYDAYSTHNFSETTTQFGNPETHFYQQNPNPNTHFTNFYDSLAYNPYLHAPPVHTLEPAGSTGFMVIPKSEPTGFELNNTELFNNRIGLNLGGRTYFANSEDDFVNRLYRRSRILEPGSVNYPRCQAEGCNADLTHAKHYHRRHKVCEFHSKSATLIVAGLTQRFCQQCSRFHLLSEFDNGKRSCRRRLADHNRRRRKSSQQSNNNQENSEKYQLESNAPNSSSERSPLDSDPLTSSVTVAISPPLDRGFGHKSYNSGTTSSNASTSSLYYSNGN